ncbi:protein MALE DISCOVERER 2 precursor [Oryza sativa Japonica Group]|uniref:Os07g0693000 protein n=3 Tax=Oryza TaxID=4527 RepID=Q84NQ1_ORYSJ|nr:protein MALE DISCOVERER 2 precursor [Oryza sativa Japonica Group]KAB8106993.1 hypothetical protein EE612_041546 [Oryza sativa]EAZ41183.1 hypothetical protein OsJ_25683 [Oryza sativa Japonica Group]KAF2924673.1 hypothetical protein DAI22_07g283700 [Oryza sativa Japonica Group]BAC75564.1 putative leucine-rich repeat transmembrane protein kinase 1 [Oryza sativa Japonica Group]BAF22640.1 Os07g0693000 [Oryza sativa Japonica Group]|eukprot:NP_001060726.1 Os07g0693000 [Oryza sativa Japonica Group]
MALPLLRLLLLLVLSSVPLSCQLAHSTAADTQNWGQTSVVHLRNAHTRKLLGLLDDISGRTGSLHALLLEESPKQAPPHHHNRHGGHHRAAHTPAPSPAPSPSPFTAPPKSASPAAITIPISPSTPQPKAESNPAVEDAPAQPRHSWRNYGLVTAGSAVFLVMTIASVIYCRAKKVGTVRPWATGLSGQLQRAFVTGVPSLKRSELEAACEDFSNIIGSTSSCMLYKGTLSSGVEIAVLTSSTESGKEWSKECESQYRKKITNLSKVSHKNFMNLLGYCEEENLFTRAMVFEYAPNGTLFEYLHVREAENLDWMARVRISMGIAYCLEHMHQLNPPVVPRNFNSTTIYLTDDFAAKVSDLDFWNDSKGSFNSATSDETVMVEIDSMVHQYGIILLEILTGRVPYSESDGPLEHWASGYFEGKMTLAELIDPSLGSFPEDAARALCDVARWCIEPEPSKRPLMSQVAGRMKEITSLGPEGATPKVSPLWWAELEIMSGQAT